MKRVILILLVFGKGFSLVAQQTIVSTAGDEIALSPDSYDGAIHWQVSNDNIEFTSADAQPDGSFRYTVSSFPVYIRAVVSREGCAPHYSEVIEILEENTTILLWSDPDTWGGSKPVAGEDVEIPFNTSILLDEDTPMLGELDIHGTLYLVLASR